ncbi:MAG: chemotaxis protein CheX [Desulfobacterium sp.]|nr:chemotaxis protein CheX [Desulfobacterium sp.]
MIIEHTTPFIDAFAYVMTHYVKLRVKPEEPFFSTGKEETLTDRVTSVVELTSKGFEGFLSISFPRSLLQEAACKLLSNDEEMARENYLSLACEIVNMISARGKDRLKTQGIGFKVSLPIIDAKGIKDRITKIGKPALVIPFSVKGKGLIFFSLQIEKEARSI